MASGLGSKVAWIKREKEVWLVTCNDDLTIPLNSRVLLEANSEVEPALLTLIADAVNSFSAERVAAVIEKHR